MKIILMALAGAMPLVAANADPGAPPQADLPAAASPFAAAARMSGTDLGTVTGRDDTSMQIRAQNTSNVSGNSVTGQSQTGTISFDAQSFGQMTGLSVLSANTGNNVSINASMNVNVAVHP